MITPPQNQNGQAGTQQGSASGARAGTTGNGNDEQRLKDSAKHLGEQARDEGKQRVEEARGTAAGKVDTLADSVKAAASQLSENDIGHLSEYVSDLAENMSRLSTSLREKSGDEMLRDVTRLARENPALFITGSLAIGFGLSRFARASGRHDHSSDSETGRDTARTSGSYDAGTTYGTTGTTTGSGSDLAGTTGVTGTTASTDSSYTTRGGTH
ncbi:phasin family protein [Novilysobacter spongiicola]|uniref:Uncharacterized protein n=1 Tax=Lysobacter spongiicola DSM 21749 TaxID=1122188 RepID=A0A1T4LIJ9_9GAMM|nr:phasin family protein [Lysobacter spongiicola]SJZ54565.1 hypothetical protein SAMN02745674_00032 [Lysobacter spongiicola DSM 21749]